MRKKLLFLAVCSYFSFLCLNSNAQWTQKANVGGSGRYFAVGFSIGTKGYIGTGYAGTVISKDFWEYNPANDVWTQKTDVPGLARWKAVGFSIGTKGYVGTGATGLASPSPPFLKDFYEYDPSSNTWTTKADFGGTARQLAVGFSIGSKGYIGTGHEAFDIVGDFWEYNPTTDVWTSKAPLSNSRVSAVGFSVGSKGYIATGERGNPSAAGFTTELLEYDPGTDSWTAKANFPGTARTFATGFGTATKGYLGTGTSYNGVSFTDHNDFWEYDPSGDVWTQRDGVGSPRFGAVSFSIGTKGYLGTGFISTASSTTFYEYTPPQSLIITSLSSSTYCTSATVAVPFVTSGIVINSGNVYTAQLSNSSGSFASPTSIGTLTSTATAGSITATIPSGATAGTGYRIRVVSSNTSFTGSDNGSNITINILPVFTSINVNNGPCPEYNVSTSSGACTSGPPSCYTWKFYNQTTGAPTQTFPNSANSRKLVFNQGSGTYNISVSATNSCGAGPYFSTTKSVPCNFFRMAVTTITLSPNPVKGDLLITTSDKKGFRQIIIRDKLGSIKKSVKLLPSMKTIINVSDLPMDVYEIQVFDGVKWSNEKFIKN